MTDPALIAQSASTIVRSLLAVRRNNPVMADAYAQTHLAAFISYWEANHGPADVVRVLEAFMDSQIPKALRHDR